jgi:hypothetical protein
MSLACMNPSMSLLCKLASVAAHAQESLGPQRHEFDLIALQQLLADREVKAWLDEMLANGFSVVAR